MTAKAKKLFPNTLRYIDRTTLSTALTVGVLFFTIAGCCSTCKNRIPDDAQITTKKCDGLFEEIKQSVRELEYSEKTAEDFVRMVTDWKTGNSRPVLVIWKRELIEAEQNYKHGKISSGEKSRIEQRITTKLCSRIRNEIDVNDKVFDLSDIIKSREAQCLGYTQLYYILGKALGLSVRPINAVELEGRRRLGTGEAHISCIVDLSDGRTIMLDLVPEGFVSRPFIFERKFQQTGPQKVCWQLNDDDNALKIFRKIEILDAKGLAACRYNNLGNFYSSSEQLDNARHSYNRAIELNPNFAEAYNNRGVVQQLSGNLEQALSDYSMAIKLRPDNAEALNNRGTAYKKKGQLNKAISDYTRAIELKPDCAQAYNNRANVYAKMHKFEQAIADYNRAIKRDSKLAKAYGNRAVSFAILGKHRGAKKDLLKAVQLNPRLRSYASTISHRFNLGLSLNDKILLSAK